MSARKAKGDASALTEKQAAQKLAMKVKTLERELAERSESTARAVARKQELEGQVRDARSVIELEQDDRRDIMSSMARQYKANHDALTEQINRLSADLMASQEELRLTRAALQETIASRDKLLQEKDSEIATLKQQMDEMAQAFGVMLNDTLEQISSRIQQARESYETQAVLPSRSKALDLKMYQ
eukprot:c42011_g1_i1.p2 GENE.c42011_g1_i1~~c42011_g1_i1.p2  ORF type:complete len:185 (-),score=32.57 c42011_g1_i1:178-732(-)